MELSKAILIAMTFALIWSVPSFSQTVLQGGDNISNATPVPYLPFGDNGTTVGYTNDYSYCGENNAPDVVYVFQATYDMPIMISLCNGSDFDTQLYVFEDTPGNVVACNDDYCGFQSQISCLMLHGGHNYYIIVDGYANSAGNYTIDFSQPMPPIAISGIVTESGDGPICEATVRILQDDTQVWQDTTQADGRYWVISLPSGTYTVEASKQGFYTQTSAPFSIGECDGEVVDFALERIPPPPIGTLAGVVFEDDGTTPIEGALVRAEYTDGSWFIYDTTGADGQFSFPEMQCVLYNMQASKDGYIPQTLNDIEVLMDQTTRVVFELQHEIFLCPYMPGDVNGNGSFNGLDIVYMVSYFKGGPVPGIDCHPYCPNQPDPFFAGGDVNGDCVFNGLDIVFFVTFLKGWIHELRYCPDCPPAP